MLAYPGNRLHCFPLINLPYFCKNHRLRLNRLQNIRKNKELSFIIIPRLMQTIAQTYVIIVAQEIIVYNRNFFKVKNFPILRLFVKYVPNMIHRMLWLMTFQKVSGEGNMKQSTPLDE